MRPYNRRRNVLINPRFQGGIALVFAAIVFAGGALFAWIVYRDAKTALFDASMRGHFTMQTPYEIVGESLVRRLAWLFAAVLSGCAGAFFFAMRMIRKGIGAIVSSLSASALGDLSTPTPAWGMEEIAAFAHQVDEVRRASLARLEEIRGEVERLRRDPPPEEEFEARWEELRRKVRGIAP